jgi:hypothetical protein
MALEYWDRNELIWVAPGAVRYDSIHVDFLLPWLPEMEEGIYPAEPTSGYSEGGHRSASTRAYYSAACEVAGELNTRLARTGLDRYLVRDFYCTIWDDATAAEIYTIIGRRVNKPSWDVRRCIKNAVSYISSGPCQRWVECSGCIQFARCRKKKKQRRTAINYAEWCRRRNYRENRVSLKDAKKAPTT